MSSHVRQKYLFLTTLFLSIFSSAQVRTDYVTQIQFDLNPSYVFNPGFQISGEIGYQKQMVNDGWTQITFTPYVRTWLGKRMNFYVGIGNYYTFNEVINDRWEIRPYQAVAFRFPSGNFTLRHRIRLEERFDFDTGTWESENEIRARYRVSSFYRWNVFENGKYWEADVAAEFYFNLNGGNTQFQEQAKVTFGIDRGLNETSYIRFEISWLKEKLFDSSPISDVYFRLRFFKYWGRRS
jgi:hypothetical protein